VNDAELELLVKKRILDGQPEWIDRWLAIQTLATLRSIDKRLETLGSLASGSIAGELRTVSDMLRVVVTKLNR
jgi:hypothetical protein